MGVLTPVVNDINKRLQQIHDLDRIHPEKAAEMVIKVYSSLDLSWIFNIHFLRIHCLLLFLFIGNGTLPTSAADYKYHKYTPKNPIPSLLHVNGKDVKILVSQLPTQTINPLYISRSLVLHCLQLYLKSMDSTNGLQLIENIFYNLKEAVQNRNLHCSF